MWETVIFKILLFEEVTVPEVYTLASRIPKSLPGNELNNKGDSGTLTKSRVPLSELNASQKP